MSIKTNRLINTARNELWVNLERSRLPWMSIQWTGDNLKEIIKFSGLHHGADHMSWEEYANLVDVAGLKIFTLEGSHMASVGDWIIRGVQGEYYPCKPDIFEMTYDEVGEESILNSYITVNKQMIIGAELFAAAAHGAINQKRKYSGENYISHPKKVAEFLAGRKISMDKLNEIPTYALIRKIDRIGCVATTAVRFGVNAAEFKKVLDERGIIIKNGPQSVAEVVEANKGNWRHAKWV